MTDSLPIPRLIWQSDIEALVSIIKIRQEKLSVDFNAYVVSETTMALAARIQRHVNACYERDGYGLLTRRNHHEQQKDALARS